MSWSLVKQGLQLLDEDSSDFGKDNSLKRMHSEPFYKKVKRVSQSKDIKLKNTTSKNVKILRRLDKKLRSKTRDKSFIVKVCEEEVNLVERKKLSQTETGEVKLIKEETSVFSDKDFERMEDILADMIH